MNRMMTQFVVQYTIDAGEHWYTVKQTKAKTAVDAKAKAEAYYERLCKRLKCEPKLRIASREISEWRPL